MLNNAKNAILVIAASLVALVLVLVAVLIILDKDPTTYVGSLTTLVGVLASSGILAAMIGKQNEKVKETKDKTDQIATSVNGNTSHLLQLVAELAANQSSGRHVEIDNERLDKIKADSDALTGPTPVID